ncbi:MAG: HAMP domain-containing histidine kinase [Bacteroidaceae bacterium]|nr:HAMP domain-containing histidine kinase [Bacteroidaceae bacterium]
MRKHLIYLFILVLLAGCLPSCSNKTPKGAARSILVIHSWDNVGEEGEHFSHCMEKAFQDKGVNAELHHIYANMLHRSPRQLSEEDWGRYADSIRQWRPEIILLNDDPILRWVLQEHTADSLFIKTPVVFAGINVLLRDSLQRYPLMTGFGNNLNLPRCMEMLLAITNSQIANIELDYNAYDDALRRKFYGQISDSTRFINNNVSHMEGIDNDAMEKNYPAKVLINFISCANPETNAKEGEPREAGKRRLTDAYLNARHNWHVQVKYDIFSDGIIDKAQMPQFTCIRQQFNLPEHDKILGGYFTSTETQVKDQVEYAVRILDGTSPKSLPIAVHESGYYLDYIAMQKLKPALNYELVADRYKVVNAPLALENPMRYLGTIALIALLVTGFIAIFGQVLYLWRRRSQNAIIDSLVYEEKMHGLLFSDGMDTLWHWGEGTLSVGKEYAQHHNLSSINIPLKHFYKMVHPDSQASLDTLKDFRNQRGKKTIRMKLSFDKGETWSWYEMTYTATPESSQSGDLYGLMLNIDKKRETEETLLQAQTKASEVALKENFFANISHDLRTPLNAITGFSQMLTDENMTFAPGEREEYSKYIHQNTELILNMINSVVAKAQNNDNDIHLFQKPVNVATFVNEVYQTNKILVPANLQLYEEKGKDNCFVNIDVNRTTQVINNFLSNAFKFTPQGSVTLGWKNITTDAGEEQVEIFVRDTGIGISEEHQKNLFDRFYKENETDRGTGLGLNISQTIMQKQGGTIGVKSQLDKGSTFFIRMPRYIQTLLLLLVCCCGLASCNKYKEAHTDPKNIIVIHGYSQDFLAYKAFDEKIASTLRQQNINADIRNIYLRLEDPASSGKGIVQKMADSLNRHGWKADLILSEGDRTAYDISKYKLSQFFPYIDDVPIVFGSLHHPNWNFLREHKNTVVFYDPIDYATNINLAVQLTGVNVVDIELDYFDQDIIIREELLRSIARPPYVCNSEYFPTNYNISKMSSQYKDSIMVYTISVESPEKNIRTTALKNTNNQPAVQPDTKERPNYLQNIYMNAWAFPQLSVKRDIYCKEIINKTHRPQFTAVKAGFADGYGTYLAGYFADYNTVAFDIAFAGAKILQGANAKDLSGKQHEKHYFMDYQAMQTLGYKYEDYANRFTIVGAPLRYSNPLAYYSIHIALILFAGIAFCVWLMLVNFLRERTGLRLLESVRHKAAMRMLALNGADSRPVRNEEEMNNVFQRIHPDHRENLPLIQQAMQIAGAHQYDIYADVDEDGAYEWWQLRFVSIIQQGKPTRIDGLVININESKQNEEKLRTAIRLAEEAKQKEDFLMTISHEIRTPLNAVVGFSDIITSLPPEALTPEELKEFGKTINENNKKLSVMIEDILMFSRIESGRLKYIMSEFNTADIINDIAEEWKNKVPEGVQFIVSNFRTNTYIHSDRQRLKYLLNQLISNAFKFTQKGSIALQTLYHYDTSEVEFIVEDTGCGISNEKQQAVFNLFWKNNEFVPGLGLGLNIARRLADGMNARLQLGSREGFGSTLSLFIHAELRNQAETSTAEATLAGEATTPSTETAS